MPETAPLDIAARRAELEARIAALDAKLRAIETELDSHQSRDWDELAQEREGDEVLESEGQAGKVEIARIRAALARMDAGEYGYCTRCGDEIEAARLDLLPATPFCASCAAEVAG